MTPSDATVPPATPNPNPAPAAPDTSAEIPAPPAPPQIPQDEQTLSELPAVPPATPPPELPELNPAIEASGALGLQADNAGTTDDDCDGPDADEAGYVEPPVEEPEPAAISEVGPPPELPPIEAAGPPPTIPPPPITDDQAQGLLDHEGFFHTDEVDGVSPPSAVASSTVAPGDDVDESRPSWFAGVNDKLAAARDWIARMRSRGTSSPPPTDDAGSADATAAGFHDKKVAIIATAVLALMLALVAGTVYMTSTSDDPSTDDPATAAVTDPDPAPAPPPTNVPPAPEVDPAPAPPPAATVTNNPELPTVTPSAPGAPEADIFALPCHVSREPDNRVAVTCSWHGPAIDWSGANGPVLVIRKGGREWRSSGSFTPPTTGEQDLGQVQFALKQ